MAPSAAVALLALAVCSLPRAQFHAIHVSTAAPPSGAVAPPKENAEDASEEKGILPWFSVPSVDSLPPGSQGSNFSSLPGSQGTNTSSPTGLQGDGVSGVELQSALDDSSVRNSPCDGDSADCGKDSSNPDKVVVGEHSNLKDSVANSTDASNVEDDARTRFSSDWSEIQDITQERPHRLNTTNFVTPDPLRNTSPVNLTQPHTNSTTISTSVVITTTVDTRSTTLPPAPTSSKARGNPPSEKPTGGSESQKPRGHATVGKKNASTTKTSVSSQPTHHLARHFTGFVQHVWLPNSTPRPPGMYVCLPFFFVRVLR